MNPRLAHTLDAATDGRAVPSSLSTPGCLITGNRSLNQPTLDSTPRLGCSRNNHIRLATATDVATVEEKIARKAPTPRTYLSASAAKPIPRASPIGTVMSANLIVTATASRNSLLRITSTYWPHPLDVQLLPWASQRCWPNHTARTRG